MKLPCISCICLPVCKAQYLAISTRLTYRALCYYEARCSLEDKCDILYNYTRDVTVIEKTLVTRRNKLQTFMDPNDGYPAPSLY
jgi:hypothetical protein